MKEKIHPDYKDTTITCACGEVIHTRATKQNLRIDICSKCHPFFTGKQKLVDTAGRIDKFKKRVEKASTVKSSKKDKQGSEASKSEKPRVGMSGL